MPINTHSITAFHNPFKKKRHLHFCKCLIVNGLDDWT